MTARAKPHPDRRAYALLIISAAVTLALHAPHLPLWLPVPAALLLALCWKFRRRGRRFPVLARYALVLALPLGVVASYGTIFGRLPGAALAVGLLTLKLTETETLRDARIVIATSAFVLMSALLFGQSLLQTALVCVALWPLLTAAMSLEPAAGPTRELMRGSASRLILALPIALVAFVLIPRLAAPLWGAPGMQVARTGISARMTPGAIGQLLIDDRPAFRVGFRGPIPARPLRYFRAVVLWHFDGRSWTPGHAALPLERLIIRDRPSRYTVTLDATRQTLLPALDVPVATAPGTLSTAARTLLAMRPVDHTLRYTLESATGYALSPQLVPAERRLGLQLPSDADPRARALAAQWRARYGTDARAIVAAALRMFHYGGFRYTLAPPPLGRQQVDDFLFRTRAGFCEHYASAFVFLMRAAGVPARVVAGYQGGYANRTAGYLLVRQSDAHAWAEVWIPGDGWMRVDPTAAVSPDRISLGATAAAQAAGAPWFLSGWWIGFRNRIDVVNRLWDQAVVGFDALRQHALLTQFGLDPSRWQSVALALGGALGMALAVGLALALREPGKRGDALATGFQQLERRLTRAGCVRRPGEAPVAYLRRAASSLLPPAATTLLTLAGRFAQLRYGGTQPPPPLAVRDWVRRARDFRP